MEIIEIKIDDYVHYKIHYKIIKEINPDELAHLIKTRNETSKEFLVMASYIADKYKIGHAIDVVRAINKYVDP